MVILGLEAICVIEMYSARLAAGCVEWEVAPGTTGGDRSGSAGSKTTSQCTHEQLPDPHADWDAYQRAACRKAPRDYGACSNYTAITKFDAGQDDHVGANPAMLANLDGIYMFPLAKIVSVVIGEITLTPGAKIV